MTTTNYTRLSTCAALGQMAARREEPFVPSLVGADASWEQKRACEWAHIEASCGEAPEHAAMKRYARARLDWLIAHEFSPCAYNGPKYESA